VAIFMKYEGIDGESQVRGRTGFLELASIDWGCSRSMSAVKAGARADADVRFTEFVVTRLQDSKSALLFDEALRGTFERKVELHFVRTGPNNRPISGAKIELHNAGIGAYSFSGSGAGDGVPMESLTLYFTKIIFESSEVSDALAAIPNTAEYDIAAGR
jgi:type VI secretion system secreted protein Hcp